MKQSAARSKEEAQIQRFSGSISDGRLYEAIYHPDLSPQVQFVVAAPGENHTLQELITDGNKTFHAPLKRLKWIENKSVILPSGIADYGDTSALLERIKVYVAHFLDFGPYEISLIAHFAMMTWVWDAFHAFPYLRFKGEPETGKTRCLEVQQQLCYRATCLGGSSSTSSLFRMIDDVQGTTLIDESEYDANLKSDVIKMLNMGYTKNGTHTLTSTKQDIFEPEVFKVSGPKVLTNRLDFPDNALETRCLTINTQSKQLADHIPRNPTPEFFTEAEALRNQLLRWRIDNLAAIRAASMPKELLTLSGRASQLAFPLYVISPDHQFKNEFLRRMGTRSAEMYERDPRRIVLEAIIAVKQAAMDDLIPLASVRLEVLRLARLRDVPDWQFNNRRLTELARDTLVFEMLKRRDGQYVVADSSKIAEHSKLMHLD